MPDSTNGSQQNSRRNFLKVAGGVSAFALAGCSGDGDGTPGSGTGSGGGGGQQTGTATSESMEGTAGITAFEMGAMPAIDAFRSKVQERSDGRFTGSLRQFGKSQLIAQSMISGSLDFGVFSPGTAFTAIAAGNDLRILSTGIAGTDYVLAVREDKVPKDGVEGLQYIADNDLKFGLAGRGGLSHTQPVGVMVQEGIDPDNVNFVEIGGSSARTSAIASGKVATSAIHLEQFESLKSQDIGIKKMIDFRDYFPDMVQECLAVTSSFLEDGTNEAFAQNLVTAHLLNNQRFTDNFELAYETTQKYQASPLTEEEAQSVFDELMTMEAWPTELKSVGYEAALTQLSGAGLVDESNINLDEILVNKYSDKAQESL